MNWQIRGELQSLRFRVMTDQRPSAQKVQATTVSLNQVTGGSDQDETTLESLLVDEDAVERTEAAASAYLARAATQVLIEEFVRKGRTAALDQLRRKQGKRAIARAVKAGSQLKGELLGLDPDEVETIEARLEEERRMLEEKVFGELDGLDADGTNRERVRQLGKRAARGMAELAKGSQRFRVMTDYAPTIVDQPNRGPRRAPHGGGGPERDLAA